MATFGSLRVRDEAILVARILLIVLFLVFGWGKLTDYSGTAGYMARTGAPAPSVAALVAIAVVGAEGARPALPVLVAQVR